MGKGLGGVCITDNDTMVVRPQFSEGIQALNKAIITGPFRNNCQPGRPIRFPDA